jgi:hypothetical protein
MLEQVIIKTNSLLPAIMHSYCQIYNPHPLIKGSSSLRSDNDMASSSPPRPPMISSFLVNPHNYDSAPFFVVRQALASFTNNRKRGTPTEQQEQHPPKKQKRQQYGAEQDDDPQHRIGSTPPRSTKSRSCSLPPLRPKFLSVQSLTDQLKTAEGVCRHLLFGLD